MPSVIVACETLRDELEYAMSLTGVRCDIRWVEAGLHNHPEKLRERLQAVLDSLAGYGSVLMAFGTCGNSVLGLRTGAYTLVLPRVDDCISLLVGSVPRRIRIGEDGGTYFLTPGWLRGERNLWVEYRYAAEKYGAQKADIIMKAALNQYKYLGALDIECYDGEALMAEVHAMARQLGLVPKSVPASVGYLCALLRGGWDEGRFCVFPPHSRIEEVDLDLRTDAEQAKLLSR